MPITPSIVFLLFVIHFRTVHWQLAVRSGVLLAQKVADTGLDNPKAISHKLSTPNYFPVGSWTIMREQPLQYAMRVCVLEDESDEMVR